MQTHVRHLILLALLVPTAASQAHDDLVGTRFVASTGVDSGDCDDNHEPCRTLDYALGRVDPGDAIKLPCARLPLHRHHPQRDYHAGFR